MPAPDTSQKDKSTATQPPLLNLPKHKHGDTIVVGDKAGKFLQYSGDNKKIRVEFNLQDGLKSKQWIDLATIEGNANNDTVGEQHAAPDPEPETPVPPTPAEAITLLSDMAKWNGLIAGNHVPKDSYPKKQYDKHIEQWTAAFDLACSTLRGEASRISELTATTNRLSEELKSQKALVLVANRQTEAAKTEIKKAEAEATARTQRPLEPGEIQTPGSRIKELEAENTRLKQAQQRPLVEVKSIIRPVNVKTGIHDDSDIAKWFTDGWIIVPELTESMIENEADCPWERITFRRLNGQPIQPYHSLSEIDKAFDTQADRNHPILRQSGTPLTDLMRQGISADEIKNAFDGQAFAKAQAAGLASKASRQPVHSSHSFNRLMGSSGQCQPTQ